MKIITIVSPDKITQSMFTQFYKTTNSDKTVIVLEISSLFSPEVQEIALSEAIEYTKKHNKENTTDILIKYKAKAKTCILSNERITDLSDYIIKFDLFSTHPEVLKESEVDYLKELLLNWGEYVERLNKAY